MKTTYLLFSILFLLSELTFAQKDLFSQLDARIQNNYLSIEEQTQKDLEFLEQQAKAKPPIQALLDAAKKAQSLTEGFQSYVNGLRNRMVSESGGAFTKEEAEAQGYPELEGKPKGKKDRVTPDRIFVTGDYEQEKRQPQGLILGQKILDLKAAYLQLAEALWQNKKLEGTIFSDPTLKTPSLEQLEKDLILTSFEHYQPEKHHDKSWSEYTFGQMPVAAIYPMLRKFQHDANISQNSLISFLANSFFASKTTSSQVPFGRTTNRSILKPSTPEAIALMQQKATKKPQFQALVDVAKKAQVLTVDFHSYVNALRDRMVLESGGVFTKEEAEAQDRPYLEGKPKGKKDKISPNLIFLTGDYEAEKRQPEGPILKQKMMDLEATYLQLAEALWQNKKLEGTIFADPTLKARALENLAEEMELSSSENYAPEEHNGKTWSEYTFLYMPVAAIYPMMRKFQNDAKNSEATLIRLLSDQCQ